MNKMKLLVGVVVWALIVALTLLIFFVIVNDPSGTQVTGLVFILIAQTIALGVFISTDFVGKKSEKVYFNSASYSITGAFLIISHLISIIFIAVDGGGKWLALLNGVLLILFAIMFVLLLYSASVLGSKNREILMAVGANKQLEIRFLTLKNQEQNKPYIESLNKLYECAKYCDNTVYSNIDKKLESLLDELEQSLSSGYEGVSENATNLMSEMLVLYKQRAEEVKANKGGGF